ncbi:MULTISPECIES: 50S ribosomal protein L24 [Cellulophaga]|jgi:large subunit ribosomal protein L24|uniref:Large ribosomal subunit protein uL24 n=2 Tax=Cellulophaga baltica TaxID=76594 RepID=A0A1G7EIS9_9FLAO|nr:MULTISPECIES: 50S ribosomal protein L24 [Cellulophaga]WFO15721.1 50S ribosomal protein L24 [Cellulophaga baltica 4]AIY11906.1 50S ribosomal protein L24 [Cellulophaga baltica NN016038]AIZ40271.1 50S ribosomal protein L24 [Cellulophaga baltica 18]KGK29389.1 50S ribosomal protein L24 [Cellulophaga sp. E6(2014)]MBA6314295.1 50S ribosomal protein L24 [Cellulophaga baltica]
MKKLKIKVGDIVRIVAGDHKGVEGKIMKIDFDKNKAIVEGANMVSKHEKPSAKNPQGGIVKKEALLHISNLALIDAKSGSTTRVGYDVRDGKKVRVSKKSNEVI